MMISSKPSPLTSPAPATEQPLVICIDAVEAEAVGAVEGREVEAGTEPRGSAEHDVALADAGVAIAPMMRSSKPSPLTSPAPATENR